MVYSTNSYYFYGESRLEEREDYERMLENFKQGKDYLEYSEERRALNNFSTVDMLTLYHRILSKNTQQQIGVCSVSVPLNEFINVMENANITHEGLVYLQNDRGDIIVTSNQELYERIAEQSSFPGSGEEYEGQYRVIAILLVAFAVIIAFVIAIIATILSGYYVGRLSRLRNEMTDLQGGNLNVQLPVGTEGDEIEAVYRDFNFMVNEVQRLMQEHYQLGKNVKMAEIRALQAQINPHFLYNTLDSIQWMCERGETEDAARMVGALARLFRISISRGRELIPLRDELQHAKSYLVIQSYRYRDQFRYRFEVEAGLEEYLCNKITLQPLIENAIYHGIDRMVDEGEIVVTVKQAPDRPEDILITVSDNGVGMTQEQCRAILEKQRSDSGGIGVKNVSDRLRIYFGSEYGLTIHSELDVGTTVTVRIPKIDREATHYE